MLREKLQEGVLHWLLPHGLIRHVGNIYHRMGIYSSLLDLMVTRYQGDIRELTIEEPLGERDHVVIKFVLWIPNEPTSRFSARFYYRLRHR